MKRKTNNLQRRFEALRQRYDALNARFNINQPKPDPETAAAMLAKLTSQAYGMGAVFRK